MWLIPSKTKVQIELIKGVSITDMIVGAVCSILVILTAMSTLPYHWQIAGGMVFISVLLLVRIDTEPNYLFLLHLILHFSYRKNYHKRKEPETSKQTRREKRSDIADIMAFTGIADGFIEYAGEYYGAVLEIPPVEFRFFSAYRRNGAIINGVGSSIRNANPDYAMNIVKLERPVIYDEYIRREYEMVRQLRAGYEQGAMDEEEFKIRIEILDDRIRELESLTKEDKVIVPFYYMVFFDKNPNQLDNQMREAIRSMSQNDMEPRRLEDKELAVFLRYNYDIDFDEREIDEIEPDAYARWAMPDTVSVKGRTIEINRIVTNNMRIVKFPTTVDDSWLASVMSYPATRVMVKCKPMDRSKAIRKIDWSLQELRGQYRASSSDSKILELQNQIESLTQLLVMLQNDNETLLNCNVYITTFDIDMTNRMRSEDKQLQSERFMIPGMKKQVRRAYQENEFRLNNLDFEQMNAFLGAQVSAFDPLGRDSWGIPSNSIAASYPWVFANVSDIGGMKLGSSDHVPVFIDFFRRDSERINSNMVIIGKSGSGKSYATKSLLTNLATEDAKIFILDPENEYTELAQNLHGKFINVGNAQYGRLNPFHIITALDDDEVSESVSGSYATHLQFLEEFFRQILPDCEKESLEYLNNLIDRMYFNFEITAETNLAMLEAADYPTFDDLYDIILEEFQQTDNEYIKTMLRTLMNYIAKFSSGGRNANIWNGPSTITTEENFTVFNFQSLLSNRNQTIANAQMLLVLKYIDNEIIKNRDYNEKYHAKRKIVVVIDEAHVFIDDKFPIALDFMYQLAKRIRKYNGMQIVITQNIKDFVGSEELAKKSTAIINACQYSLIFSLAPNDMEDLCRLYEKAGGINEIEQESIVSAPRGQAFAVMSPTSRTTFQVEVPPAVVDLFQNRNYQTHYFNGEDGDQVWESFIGESRALHEKAVAWKQVEDEVVEKKSHVTFEMIDDEDEENDSNLSEQADTQWKDIERNDIRGNELERDENKRSEIEPNEIRQNEIKSNENDPNEINPNEFGEMEIPKGLRTPDQLAETGGADQKPSPGITERVIYQQAPAPQVTIDMSTTNNLLSSFLEKFSGEAIRLQVEKSVKAAMEDIQIPQAAEAKSAALGNIFDLAREQLSAGETADSSPMEESGETYDDRPYEDDDENAGGFDIMSLLQEEAESLSEMSKIEQMEYYEEEVVDIKLEDLVKYTKSRQSR